MWAYYLEQMGASSFYDLPEGEFGAFQNYIHWLMDTYGLTCEPYFCPNTCEIEAFV